MAEPLRSEVETYYRGERNEVFLTVGTSAVATVLAAAGYAARGGEFALAFAAAVVVAGGVSSATALRRWWTHARIVARLTPALDTRDPVHVMGDEARRLANVIARFVRRQYFAVGAGVVALALAVALDRAAVAGVAACVMLLVVVQQAIDHYAEERALRYARALGTIAVTPRVPAAAPEVRAAAPDVGAAAPEVRANESTESFASAA